MVYIDEDHNVLAGMVRGRAVSETNKMILLHKLIHTIITAETAA